MGLSPPAETIDTAQLIDLLGFDRASTTSIAGALVAARENARSARDSISSEMWECLNATYNALPGVIANVVGGSPHAFFAYVKERAAILGRAEGCLADLDPGAGRAGLDDEARRLLWRARTELEFRRVHELIADLPSYLRSLQAACSEAGDAVAERFFRQSAPLEWSLEVTGGRQ